MMSSLSTPVKALHPLKACFPIDLIFEKLLPMEVKLSHKPNTAISIDLTISDRSTDTSLVHPMKRLSGIVVIPPGKFITLTRFESPLKAFCGKEVSTLFASNSTTFNSGYF